MKIREIRAKMKAMLSLAEKEGRVFTDEEQKQFDELRRLKAQAKQLRELEQEDKEDEETPSEEPKAETETPSEEEQKAEGEEQKPEEGEEQKPAEEEETPKEEEPKSEEASEEEQKEDEEECTRSRKKLFNINHKNMEQRFSLLGAIRDVVKGRDHNDANAAVIERGRKQAAASGLGTSAHIILPTEYRTITAGTQYSGKEAHGVDTLDIVAPLYTNSALAGLGATILTDLVGDVEVPVLGAGSTAWKGETAAASDAAPSTGGVKLTPNRLTAYVDISDQFLLQDSVGAEEMIMADLARAIKDKLESTIFGSAAASNSPAGIFNAVTPESAALTYGDIIDIIASMEGANVYNGKWLMNPLAKAAMSKVGVKSAADTASLGFVFSNNEILGMPAVVSGNVVSKGLAYGNWEDLVIGNWGGVQITVDNLSQQLNGCVRLVVDSYWDAKVRRTGTISKKILA